MTLAGANLAPLGDTLKISLHHTKPYRLSGSLERRGPLWTFRQFRGSVGKSDLGGDFSVSTAGERPLLTAQLHSKSLDVADLGGFVGVDTGSSFCQWFDAGIKGVPGNASNMMNDIIFAYCSAALDVASGGPGGSVELGFYEGYTVGGGAPTTVAAIFSLGGLPANSSSSSFFGGFTCYFIRVTFTTMVCFADGNVGYSWKFLDVGNSGFGLAATWPFLSCVQSCTGPGPDGIGMVDLIDEYCPVGFLRATFTFGTTPFGGYFTSMSMSMDEATLLFAVTGVWNGDSINGDSLSAPPAALGGMWQAMVGVGGAIAGHTHGAGPMTLKVRTGTVNGPNFPSPFGGRLTEILINGQLLLTQTGAHGATGASSFFASVSIPKDFSLLCFNYSAQATVVGGGFGDFSRAITGTTGTQ